MYTSCSSFCIVVYLVQQWFWLHLKDLYHEKYCTLLPAQQTSSSRSGHGIMPWIKWERSMPCRHSEAWSRNTMNCSRLLWSSLFWETTTLPNQPQIYRAKCTCDRSQAPAGAGQADGRVWNICIWIMDHCHFGTSFIKVNWPFWALGTLRFDW